MQSTSIVSALSLIENAKRRFKPRKGQLEAAEYIETHPEEKTYNVELPTGYGKSITLLWMYAMLREVANLTRLLIVVPTDTQLQQYRDNLLEDAELLGIDLRGVKIVDDEVTLKYHRENRAEIFITTIQKITAAADRTADESIFINLLSTGLWGLGADEHHHYGQNIVKNGETYTPAWSKAILGLNVARTIAMSAISIRNDNRHSIFGEPNAAKVTLDAAYKEKAIRRVQGHVEHYFLDASPSLHSDVVERLTTESLRKDGVESFTEYEMKRELRYHSKYLPSIFGMAVGTLLTKNMNHEDQHQMLVFCMSCAHAKFVSNLINSMGYGQIADWIGVGPNGRKREENTKVLDHYKANKLPVLVQVDMAGEGFNNIRSSVLVFLTLIGKTPKAVQYIGRGLRTNSAIPFEDDVCDIFLSPDTALVDLVKDMELIAEGEATSKEDPVDNSTKREDDKGQVKFLPLPPWMILNVEHERTELVYPMGGTREENMKAYTEATGDTPTKEQFDSWVASLQMNSPRSEEDKLAECRSKVNRAAKVLAGNVLRLRFGRSYEKSAFGDVMRKIQGFYKLRYGGVDNMLPEELETMYRSLDDINSQLIATRSLPLWLTL